MSLVISLILMDVPYYLQALKDPTPLLKAASTALALKTKASVKDRSKVRPQDLNNKVICERSVNNLSVQETVQD